MNAGHLFRPKMFKKQRKHIHCKYVIHVSVNDRQSKINEEQKKYNAGDSVDSFLIDSEVK